MRNKARHGSVVASILGMTESESEGIIPDDATLMDQFGSAAAIPGVRRDPVPRQDEPAEPAATALVDGEELIQPTAALVAPDVTPNALKPIDPSQVPAAPRPMARPMPHPATGAPGGAAGTMDTVLGRQDPQAEMAANAMAESLAASAYEPDPEVVQAKAAAALTPAPANASIMPDHKEGDGKRIYETFRRFSK